MKAKMRKGVLLGMLTAAWLTGAASNRVPDVEVPGDHFSLEGALELFKKASSPEEFERLLNVPDSKVNNLDLNGDRKTDYIRVIDRYDGHVHAFILQAVVSENELQDIAVIELEKHADGRATLQIVGDADIYGIETIIEPTEEVRVYAGTTTTRNVVNVWTWPVVRYVYDPYYSVWISPWGWYSRPVWWYPWRPVEYVVYRPYWDPYRHYYSVCHYHRNVYAQRIYVPVRTKSVIVYNRHHDNIVRSRNTRGRDYDRDGYYRGDYRARDARNERVRSYDNSREVRRSYAGEVNRENSVGDRSSQDRTNAGRTGVDRSVYERSSSGSDFSSTPNDRSRGESRTYSTQRQSRESDSRPNVGVSRSSSNSDRRPAEVSHTPRSSQNHGSSGGNRTSVSPSPRQNHESPRVSSPSQSQRSNHGSPGGSSSGGSSPKKRGRE